MVLSPVFSHDPPVPLSILYLFADILSTQRSNSLYEEGIDILMTNRVHTFGLLGHCMFLLALNISKLISPIQTVQDM